MKKPLASVALVALVSVGLLTYAARTSAALEAAQNPGPNHVSAVLAPGARLRVVTVSGDVSAEEATGHVAGIRARFTGRDAAKYVMHVERDADGVTVCATEIAVPSETCEDRNGKGRSSGADREVSLNASFDVTIPSDARFDALVVSGNVRSRGVSRIDTIGTVSGAIDVVGGSAVHLGTVNGRITANLSAAPRAPLSLKTVDGSIDLILPRGDYRLDASTLSGSITGAQDLLVRSHEFVGQSASATLGNGATTVKLESVAGPIAVKFV